MGPNGFLITGRDGTTYENSFKTWARADAFGENLAQVAFDALKSPTVVTEPQLFFASKEIKVPVENLIFHLGLLNGWFDAVYDYDPDGFLEDGNFPHLHSRAYPPWSFGLDNGTQSSSRDVCWL